MNRQATDIAVLRKEEGLAIPADIDFEELPGLSCELADKLARVRPSSIAMAQRIEGMTPAALAIHYRPASNPLLPLQGGVRREEDFERLHGIVGPVSRETESKLIRYGELLERWTRTSNLVAPSTLDTLWDRHILDSAQLLALKPNRSSLAGFGLRRRFSRVWFLAIMLAEKRGAQVGLVESNMKKAAFLNMAVAELGLPATVHRMRIEDAYPARHSLKSSRRGHLRRSQTFWGSRSPGSTEVQSVSSIRTRLRWRTRQKP